MDAHQKRIEDRITKKVVAELIEILGITRIIPSEEPPPSRRQLFRTVLGSGIVALFVASLFEYFAFAGVVDMSPARVMLVIAWLLGMSFCVVEVVWNRVRKQQLGIMLICGLVLAGMLYAMDWRVSQWKLAHAHDAPTVQDISDLKRGMNEIKIQLGTTSPPTTQITTGAPQIKNVLPTIPGFLKIQVVQLHDPIFAPGQQVEMNIFYWNRGSTYVHDAEETSLLYYATGTNRAAINQKVKEAFQQSLATMPKPRSDVAPGEAIWTTATADPLGENLLPLLVKGDITLYLMTHAGWTTNGKPDYSDKCSFLQPPEDLKATGNDLVWHTC